MNPSFGRYDPLFKLASGGMAEVYVARIRGEAGFEKLVAIKRMLPNLAEDERFVEMFLDEGRVAAHVSSPHVVQTFDLGRAEDGALYIVMELVLGLSLSSLLKSTTRQQRTVPIPIAVEILAQASQGLDDAHEARTPTGVHLGIVHRDVSPQNVLVGVDGRARVTDFGIARALLRRVQTSTGELKGKFSYFSPEQARGLEVDRRSDVFAMGVVAWEVLAGRRLFDGDTPMESMNKVRDMPIPTLASLRPDIRRDISAVVMRALDRDREARFQTAGELAAALRNANGTMPASREIGNWVKETSGELLARVQDRIDGSLASGDALTEALVDVQIISSSGTPSRAAAVHFAQTAVKRATSVTPPPIDAPTTVRTADRRSSPVVMIAATALLLTVLAVGAIAFAKLGPFAPRDVTASPITATAAQSPVLAPPVAPPPVLAPVVLTPTDVPTVPTHAAGHDHVRPHTGPGVIVAQPQPPVTPPVVQPPPPLPEDPPHVAVVHHTTSDTAHASGHTPPPPTGGNAPGGHTQAGHTGGLVGDEAFDHGI